MSEDEKEELQELINLLYNNHLSQYGKRKLETYIKAQQKELEKKDKIIDLMAEHIEKGCDFDNKIQTKQQILDYFIKKVEK